MSDQRIASITFVIRGRPQQQGSKTRNPHGFTREDNTKLEPWRKDALAICGNIRGMYPEIEGPLFPAGVLVTMTAQWVRPEAHYGTGRNAGVLKASSPAWKPTAPDLDKVQRALGDVLTQSGLILDDRLIVGWRTGKVWGAAALIEVTITATGTTTPAEWLNRALTAAPIYGSVEITGGIT